MVKKYSFNEEDILTYSHPDRLIPTTFPKGGGMYRFVTAEDLRVSLKIGENCYERSTNRRTNKLWSFKTIWG